MEQIKRIEEIANSVLEAQNLILYETCWRKEGSMKILQIAIMRHDGTMDIDTCSQISEAISAKLDEEDFIPYEYFLEVCSPGAERELRTWEEVVDAVGEYVYVKLKNPTAGMDGVKGTLIHAQDGSLQMEYMVKAVKKKMDIAYDNVANIRLSVKI
ncbi:MAG: ribosome maturation factor RimP [Erysipelotrichaceae bacterium]|jgi:ribosome maturation factor RimP|nr:ribosome maturation factor RimP [Erysipelotrichaceae bacterium]